MFSVRNSGLCASYNHRPKSIQPFCLTLVMFRGNTLKLDAKYSLTTLKTACLCTVFEVVKVFCDLVLLIISASSTPKGKNLKIIGVSSPPHLILLCTCDCFHPDPLRHRSALLGAQVHAFNTPEHWCQSTFPSRTQEARSMPGCPGKASASSRTPSPHKISSQPWV